jgi:inosose dehydratase
VSGLHLAATPVSWGIDFADHPDNVPWETAFGEIASLGFGLVELGPPGYLPRDGAQAAQALDALGLRAVGSWLVLPLHELSPAEAAAAARPVIAWIAAAGGSRVIVIDEVGAERGATAGDRDRAQRLDTAGASRLRDAIRAVSDTAAEAGVRPVLHAHAGTYIEFEDELEWALAELDADELGLCVDTGHCAYAGIDAAALVRRHADRLEHVHLKDLDAAALSAAIRDRVGFWPAVHAGVFCPLGQGTVDLPGVLDALQAADYTGAATVEQDRHPGAATDARGDVAASLDVLRQLGVAGTSRRR